MPRYDFECGSCHARHELAYRMAEAPGLGEIVQCPCPACGALGLRRILSLPVLATASIAAHRGYPYTTRSFTGLKGCRHTPEGHPIIKSPAHEREVAARNELVVNRAHYGTALRQ